MMSFYIFTLMEFICVLFFFSSRRRHTRFSRDWSSDVCSSDLAATLKWPNDVLLADRKVAGILTELDAEVERVHHVIVGIGVNLNTDAFPPELATKATSLRLVAGRPVDRARFTAGLLAALEARYRRFLADGF